MAGKNGSHEKSLWNRAEIFTLAFMVIVHGSVPGQVNPVPCQPLKRNSPSGVAVRVTVEPVVYTWEQTPAGQLILVSSLVTTPVPLPVKETARV